MAALQAHAPASIAPAGPNGSSILEALANMARQTSTPGNANSTPSQPAPYGMPPSTLPQPVSSSTISQPHHQTQPSYPPASQPVAMPPLPFSLPQMAGQIPALPNNASNHPNPYAAAANAAAPAPGVGGALDPVVQQQIMLIKALADQGVPFDKIPSLIQSMTGGNNAAASGPGAPLTGFQPPVPAAQGTFSTSGQQPWGAPVPVSGDGRDRGYQEGVRSPRYRGRSRSRSPDRGWGTRDSPRGGRDRGGHGRNSPPSGRHDDRERNGRGGNDYRQRSPPGRRGRSPSPPDSFPHIERWVEYDSNVPAGSIRVFSRTLFVGGVT